MVYVYDIEVYTNFFSVIFKDVRTKELKTFVIFEDRNDLKDLYSFINDQRKWFIGYNSHYYDNQILNYISKKFHTLSYDTNQEVNQCLKKLSDDIIKYDDISNKYNLPFNGIDLMRVGNLEQKPLKLVAVNLKWPKIQDLPIEPDAYIKKEQVDLLLKYNLNDVEITECLYNKLLPAIRLRRNIGKEFNINIIDETDSGISNRLLEHIFTEALNISRKQLKELGTDRTLIKYKDVIFCNVKFKTEKFQKILEDIKNGSFRVGDKSSRFNKRIVHNGCAYNLGIGGLHSEDKPGVFLETQDSKIIDADVGSYYPTHIINNEIHPKHLGIVFLKEYVRLKARRFTYKHAGDVDASDTLKRALNSVFGKTMSMTHWIRDYLMSLRITVNCQLYLMMLIEDLELNGFDVISANTDGIVTIVPRDKEDSYKNICEQWENATNFELEYTEYKKYCRRDVNNYLTIKTDDKIKLKGDFSTKIHLEKGFDAPIVSIALYEYYVNGTPLKDTIKNHKDIYDFCIAKKSDKKFTNEFHYLKEGKYHVIEELQRTNRYYVSNKGGKIYKHDKVSGKIADVCVGNNLTLFNDYFESDDYDINYSYYLQRARKIKDLIENPQLTLF